LLDKSGILVTESRVFPSLSEVESDKVVISVNKKVCFHQGISLFSELIWNRSYLTFFFFDKKSFFFYESLKIDFVIINKVKPLELSNKFFFFSNKVRSFCNAESFSFHSRRQ